MLSLDPDPWSSIAVIGSNGMGPQLLHKVLDTCCVCLQRAVPQFAPKVEAETEQLGVLAFKRLGNIIVIFFIFLVNLGHNKKKFKVFNSKRCASSRSDSIFSFPFPLFFPYTYNDYMVKNSNTCLMKFDLTAAETRTSLICLVSLVQDWATRLISYPSQIQFRMT